MALVWPPCVSAHCSSSSSTLACARAHGGPAGSAVELEAAEQSWYGVAPGCAVRYIRGCTTCDLCVIFHCRVHRTAITAR